MIWLGLLTATTVNVAEPVEVLVAAGRGPEFAAARSNRELFEATSDALDEVFAIDARRVDAAEVELCLFERRAEDPTSCEGLVALDARRQRPAVRYLLLVTGRRADLRLGLVALDELAAALRHEAAGEALLEVARFTAPIRVDGATSLPAVLQDTLRTRLDGLDGLRLAEPRRVIVTPSEAELWVNGHRAIGEIILRGRPSDVVELQVRGRGLLVTSHRWQLDAMADVERVQAKASFAAAREAGRGVALGLGAASLGLGAWAILESETRPRPHALRLGFARMVRPDSRDPGSQLRPSAGDGPLIAGVAIAAGVAGLGAAIAELLAGDDDDPWPAWLASVAAAAGAYAIVEVTHAAIQDPVLR